jgi:hypothetical protein
MLKALINLFRNKSEDKKPEILPSPAPKEPAEVKEPVVEIKPTEPEPPVLSDVVEKQVIVEIAPPPEPTPIEAAFIAEPVAVKDEVVVEVEKKPKRGRPKSGSKPKSNKKK